MNEYIVNGLKLVTDMEFPQLVPYTGRGEYPEVTVVAGEVPAELLERTDVEWEFGVKFSWLKNTTTWIIVEDGTRITYSLTGEGIPEYLGTYLLGWGMSMLAMQRGMLAVHCSVVADEDGAVLIAGESGAGKSTLTTAFLSDGYRLMADDMAFLKPVAGEKALVYPSFPYQKLCRDVVDQKGYSYDKLIYIDEQKDKFLVPYEGAFPMEAVQVKGFIMLVIGKTDEVELHEIRGMNAFQVIINNLFLRHLLKEKKYMPEIGQLCLTAASQVPVVAIIRPGAGDTREELVEKALSYRF